MTPNDTQEKFRTDLNSVLDQVRTLLINKNRKYGDAVLTPQRVFSKADTLEQIRVRLDDKLARLANQQTDEDEDVYKDLLGYLVIYEIAKIRLKREEDYSNFS